MQDERGVEKSSKLRGELQELPVESGVGRDVCLKGSWEKLQDENGAGRVPG